jgi:uncharacterized integral membrane protein
MFKKLINFVIVIPVAILLVVLAIANRTPTTLALNPFSPDDTVLSVTAPLFVYILLSLMIGVLLGGFGTWLSQHRYRKRARVNAHEAAHWHKEADRQRERVNLVVRQRNDPASPAA